MGLGTPQLLACLLLIPLLTVAAGVAGMFRQHVYLRVRLVTSTRIIFGISTFKFVGLLGSIHRLVQSWWYSAAC